jgi:hypothetical protein
VDAGVAEVVAAGLGVANVVLAGLFARERGKAKKLREREQSFNMAKTGFRACYRKFQLNAPAAIAGSIAVATLHKNFLEARHCGDPFVIRELDNYWPKDLRDEARPPVGPAPDSLISAMDAHVARSLEEDDRVRAEHSPGQISVS